MPLSYNYTGNPEIPAEISLNGNTTPVWIQQDWTVGEYAEFIRKNGCGHCCTAMVLNLMGISITPHEEFALCRQMWGPPRTGEPLFEDNFISATGIAEIISGFGVSATAYGVAEGESGSASRHIESALKEGKLVIFWSHPSCKLEDNPFSAGEHYVLAAGITEDGRILIANSSKKALVSDGIQFTDRDTIEKVLFENTRVSDYTWGRYDFSRCGAYVVAG